MQYYNCGRTAKGKIMPDSLQVNERLVSRAAYKELHIKFTKLCYDIACEHKAFRKALDMPESFSWEDCLTQLKERDGVIASVLFEDYGYNGVFVGVYPYYEYDKLYGFHFNKNDKKESFVVSGISFGLYGTGIRSTEKKLADFKRESVNTRIINKYYDRAIELYDEYQEIKSKNVER